MDDNFNKYDDTYKWTIFFNLALFVYMVIIFIEIVSDL